MKITKKPQYIVVKYQLLYRKPQYIVFALCIHYDTMFTVKHIIFRGFTTLLPRNNKKSINTMSKPKNTTITVTETTATVTAVDNREKVNATYTAIYGKMLNATCKRDLCDVLKMYGYDTTTTPTTTPNKNDLYIQFNEKSRLLITSKSLKVYTNETHATALHTAQPYFEFDHVNDGSYRTQRATVKNTVENFVIIFDYFVKNNAVSVLPQRVDK